MLFSGSTYIMAWRTFADIHSLTITVTRITSKIIDTLVQLSSLIELLSCSPIPPAPTRPNSPLRIADGALKPEFEVGDVKASVRPLRSAGDFIGLLTGTRH